MKNTYLTEIHRLLKSIFLTSDRCRSLLSSYIFSPPGTVTSKNNDSPVNFECTHLAIGCLSGKHDVEGYAEY